MTEQHGHEFDDETTEVVGQQPPSPPTGPPPAVPRPPRRLPVGDRQPPPSTNASGAGLDEDAADQDNSGAHRAIDPAAASDDGQTSVMPLSAISDFARDTYTRRIAGDPEPGHQSPPRSPYPDQGEPSRQQLPPGWAPPPQVPPRPRPPRSNFPVDAPRPDQRGQYPNQGQPGQYSDQAPTGQYADQSPPGQWSGEQRGWDQAQGSAASWNYTDSIRAGELVPTKRIPPSRGWRHVVLKASFGLINPGQSPDERYQDELVAKSRTLLRGKYKIGILGKGGVGKSTTAAGVGSIFAELRQDDRVVAIDADTAFGKLASRIDPSASGSYWELAGDRHLHSFADIRTRVGSNPAGLFVLGGDPATARRRQLDPDIYRKANIQLDRHFTLSIVDCGSTLDADITIEVLNDVDALIVVSSPWFDGASAAGQTLEWLANNGYTGLLHRTVVVINDSDGHAHKSDLKKLVDKFSGHGQKVIVMPYDEHLRPGGVVDVQGGVNKVTRRRLLELAAHCAEHFASTTDSPRGYQ